MSPEVNYRILFERLAKTKNVNLCHATWIKATIQKATKCCWSMFSQIMYNHGCLCCLWIKQADTQLFSSVVVSIKIYT